MMNNLKSATSYKRPLEQSIFLPLANESFTTENKLMLLLNTLTEKSLSTFLSDNKKKKPELAKYTAKNLLSHPHVVAFLQFLYNEINDDDLSFSDQTQLAKNFFEQHMRKPQVQILLESSSDYNHLIDAVTTLKQALPQSVDNDEHDLRVYYDITTLQRRFDSLARLLSLSSDVSACTAVTIHDGTIIVAANSKQHQDPTIIATALSKKLAVIQEAIAIIRDNSQLICNYDFYLTQINALRHINGVFHPDFILIQALFKLVHAYQDISLDAYTNIIFLVPTEELDESGDYLFKLAVFTMLPHQLGDVIHEPSDYMDYPQSSINQPSTSDFHAEQLIAHYLKQQIDLSDPNQSPIRVGVAKLLCNTCDILKTATPRLQFTGCSRVSFFNVVNLFSTPEAIQPPSTPTRSSKKQKSQTCAEMSPLLSPEQSQSAEKESFLLRHQFSQKQTSTTNINWDLDKPLSIS